MKELLKAFEKESNQLKSADIVINSKISKIYFKTMSGTVHANALELSKKTKKVKEVDGSEAELTYYDDDLIRAHIIYFQLLNEKGERIFINLSKDIDWIQKNIAYETSAFLASIIGLKSVSDLVEQQKEALKKMSG